MVMDQDGVEVHKLAKKKGEPISSHLDRTSLVNKGFIIWLSGKFFGEIFLAGYSRKSRAGKIAPSCPLR